MWQALERLTKSQGFDYIYIYIYRERERERERERLVANPCIAWRYINLNHIYL